MTLRFQGTPFRPLSVIIAIVAAIASAISVLTIAHAQADDRPEITVRLQFARAGGVYDPHRWRYTSDSFVNRSVFNTLVRMRPGTGGGELQPDLAERWELSDDGLVYTFHIRPNVQFQRGYGELTVDDVMFSFQRQIDDSTTSWHALMGNIAGIAALDDSTVQITLNEPQPSFIRVVVAGRPGFIVSRQAVEELGSAFADTPVGTGPFALDELNASGEVLLSSHDDYYGGMPAASSVRFVHIGEEAIVQSALESGEVHIAYTRGNPEVAQALLTSPNVNAETVVEYYNLMQIQMSPYFEPAQNVLVRRALAHAVNKDFIPALLPGLDQPADVMRPPQVAGGTDDVPTYPYDPTRARELLAEAGYPNGFTLRLMFQMREPETSLAQLLAESWQAIGINVVIEGADAVTAFDRRDAGDFDVTFSATSRFGDPDLFFSDVFHTDSIPPGGSNFFHFDGADDLIVAARLETDADRRDALYHELQRQLMDELPIIPLMYRAYVAAWRSPVAGLVPDTTLEFWLETVEIE